MWFFFVGGGEGTSTNSSDEAHIHTTPRNKKNYRKPMVSEFRSVGRWVGALLECFCALSKMQGHEI